MNSFVNYIVEAGLSLGVFTLVYWFILRGQTKFKATRFYLMFALLFSTLLPFLTIRINVAAPVIDPQAANDAVYTGTNLLEAVTVYASGIPAKIGSVFLLFDYTMLIYGFGALAALFVISVGIFQLWRMVAKNRVFRLKDAKLVISSRDISPYSFFNYIFIGKNLTDKHNWKTMVHHELEHVKQGHSYDVLFIDFMMVFQWFNPFYWILRRMVRENHEFLADTGVLSKGLISNAQYKMLLLSQAIGGRPVITSNFFSMKTVKKRFKMITNKKNRKYTWARYATGVMLATVLTFFLACEHNMISPSNMNEPAYVFDSEVMSKEAFEAMGIDYVQVIKTERTKAIILFPELSDQLKSEEVNLAFDITDKVQFEQAKEVQFQLTKFNSNEIDELVAVGYGIEKRKMADEQVFVLVEDMPEYPGGEDSLRSFLAQNVKYPVVAAQNGVHGRVYVQFVVGSDGQVRDPQIARGVDPALDAEALRVISTLPQWKPGKQRGVPVAVSYTVPINFQLQ
jgi:TonB family protein